MDLSGYGIPGKVIHTPGHTAGSVSIILDNGHAIVGDNVLGISIKKHFPPFANDRRGVIESWEKYIKNGVLVVYPAHGVRVPIEALIEELPFARRKYMGD
jgi:glyoxylase-like metal-dependent hydrolase (beta-lactamase superfamily II)